MSKKKLTPEQVKELAQKKLSEKFESEWKKIEDDYQKSQQEEPPDKSLFDKTIGAIMKVPKPDK